MRHIEITAPKWYRGDSLRQRASKGWIWLGPAILALALFWPIFLSDYRLDGGLSNEIVMVNGLKSAFNRALLNGQFPLWNEWVSLGKPFLIFGTYPLNFLTPFELVFGPEINQTLYKFETAAVAMIGAALFLWLGRKLSLHPAATVLGFFSCYLMHYMPYQTGLLLSANLYLWGSASVICVILYFANKNQRLILLFMAFALLTATGARPEIYSTFLLFIALLVSARMVENIALHSTQWRAAIKEGVVNILIFAVLPLTLYLWQLPLVINLAKTASARLWPSTATAVKTLEYFVTAIRVSPGTSILLAWILGLMAINIIRPRQREGSTGQSWQGRRLIASALLFLALGVMVFQGLPSPLISVTAIVALGLQTVLQRLNCESNDEMWRHLSLNVGWVWPLTVVGLNCAFIDDQNQSTGEKPLHLIYVLKVGFILGVFYALTYVGSKTRPILSRIVGYLAVCSGLGWVGRDIISLPFYELANVVWAEQRDMFWYVPVFSVLFAIGCSKAIADSKRLVHSKSTFISAQAGSIRTTLSVGAAVACVLVTFQVLTYFYLPRGAQHAAQVWRRLTPNELQLWSDRWDQRDRLYRESVRICGPDARIIVLQFPQIGFPGAEAGRGIRTAWGYDFVGDHYRILAEAAFSRNVSDLLYEPLYPRMIHYNTNAGRVYSRFQDRFPDFNRAGQLYARYQMVASDSAVDPFFFQLMGVCGAELYKPTDKLKPFEPEVWARGGYAASIRHAERQPRQFAFIDLDAFGDRSPWEALQSTDRKTLENLYGRIIFEGSEASRAGIEINRIDVNPNSVKVQVNSQRPGILIQFEGFNQDLVATVNGARVPIERAFVAMRAVPVSQGENQVEIRFHPAFLELGIATSLAALIAGIILALYFLRRPYCLFPQDDQTA